MSMRPREQKPSAVASTPTDLPAAGLEWKDLTETERSAASLGVDPEQWRPIGFLNTAHYETLLKANALDDSLARKLEAFKSVATADGN
jgi:hypothetical protein